MYQKLTIMYQNNVSDNNVSEGENDDQILCEGKAFKTRIKLTCDFHGFALRNRVSREGGSD